MCQYFLERHKLLLHNGLRHGHFREGYEHGQIVYDLDTLFNGEKRQGHRKSNKNNGIRPLARSLRFIDMYRDHEREIMTIIKEKAIMDSINVRFNKTNSSEAARELDGKTEAFKVRLADNLSTAASKVHDGSDRAENALNAGVDKVHDYAQNTVHKANVLAHKTANALESTSDYVKDFKLSEAEEQLRATVANRPAVSLAAAGFFGLAVGLLIGRQFTKAK